MTKIDFKKELNPAQYRVVTAGAGPHLVLAGAGSGKTRTLVYRVAWLVEQGVKPEKILLLTFTNKAANEMMNRAKQLIGLKKDGRLNLWGGTFHSVANRLLKIYGSEIGLKSNFTILDTEDSEKLLKIVSHEFLDGLSKKHRPSIGILRETISFAANSKISLKKSLATKFSDWLPFLESLEKIQAEYQRRKQVAGLLDFDDLLIKWKELTEHPKVGQILASKWEHILVDEYQDTNIIQAEIIFNLAQGQKNILVVGDDAQSIYSFRAADIKNILEFPDKFKNCQIHKLELNYRSSPEILALANQIFVASGSKFAKKLAAVKDNYVRPELLALRTNREEAWFIADRIEQLLGRGMKHSEIAVLFRAAHHSQNLEMELNKRGLHYEMRGGLKFFERAHIKDVLAYLKILGNFRDSISWQRVLQMWEGIGPITAQQIYDRIIELEDINQLPDFKLTLTPKAGQSWSKVRSLLVKLINHREQGLAKLLNIIVEDYSDFLTGKYPDYKQRLDDLDQLIIFAGGYQSLDIFLNEVSLQEGFNAEQVHHSSQDNIILTTVHQAKGLEWPAVFVMNLTDNSFPHPLAEDVEEERRLFYVAVTRAERYLFLTYPVAMFRYDGYTSLKPSPFVSQLENNLFQPNELARQTNRPPSDSVEYVTDGDYLDNGLKDFLPKVDDW
jgi:DNA helicase-2/ATP-dependent DNA helicase PcrA